MKISKNLSKLASLFNKADAKLYVVGGAIRNFLLKKPYSDVDICSSLSVDRVLEILTNTPYLVKIKNALTQTAQIICEGEVYEYARFRQEEYSSEGERVPSKINFVLTPQEDYLRRDFTCNALYYDITTGEILDFCGGTRDIKSKTLNTVLKPEQTLKYDALRLLRLVRFSLQYDLTLSAEVINCAKANAHLLTSIKGQAKKDELIKILNFGTNEKNYYDCNYKKLFTILNFFVVPYIFTSKLKKIQFNPSDIKQIFPLSLNCNKQEYAQACFIVDLYSYILSKQIFIDKEIFELLLNASNLNFTSCEIEHLTKLCYAYTFSDIEKQTRFFIYLNNQIIDQILCLFNFNLEYKNVIKAIKTELGTIKHKKLPLTVQNLNVTSKDVYDSKIQTNSNINYILKRVHYAVLFEQIPNDKQSIISFITKKFK